MTMRIPLGSLAFLTIGALPSIAWASGFATARFGGEHGYVVTENPTALYYNPAGLAESEGTHIWVEYDLALRSAGYQHKKAKTDLDEPKGGEGANFGTGTL